MDELSHLYRGMICAWSVDQARRILGVQHGVCLASAGLLTAALSRRLGDDHLVLIQAGSAGWRRLHAEDDDGTVDTHISCVWDPGHPASMARMLAGGLPELHAWVGVIRGDHQWLIDPTSGHWPVACRAAGMDWLYDEPPEYVWARCDEGLPEGCYFSPDREACEFAAVSFRNLMMESGNLVSLPA